MKHGVSHTSKYKVNRSQRDLETNFDSEEKNNYDRPILTTVIKSHEDSISWRQKLRRYRLNILREDELKIFGGNL